VQPVTLLSSASALQAGIKKENREGSQGPTRFRIPVILTGSGAAGNGLDGTAAEPCSSWQVAANPRLWIGCVLVILTGLGAASDNLSFLPGPGCLEEAEHVPVILISRASVQ
jgi:hypothetical protein